MVSHFLSVLASQQPTQGLALCRYSLFPPPNLNLVKHNTLTPTQQQVPGSAHKALVSLLRSLEPYFSTHPSSLSPRQALPSRPPSPPILINIIQTLSYSGCRNSRHFFLSSLSLFYPIKVTVIFFTQPKRNTFSIIACLTFWFSIC